MNRKLIAVSVFLSLCLWVATFVAGRRSVPTMPGCLPDHSCCHAAEDAASKTANKVEAGAECSAHHDVAGHAVATVPMSQDWCDKHYAGNGAHAFKVEAVVSAATLKPTTPTQEQHDNRTCTDDPNQKQDTDKLKVGCKCDTCSANEDTHCRSYCKKKNCTCKRPCA